VEVAGIEPATWADPGVPSPSGDDSPGTPALPPDLQKRTDPARRIATTYDRLRRLPPGDLRAFTGSLCRSARLSADLGPLPEGRGAWTNSLDEHSTSLDEHSTLADFLPDRTATPARS
jgi:hypothetical protein